MSAGPGAVALVTGANKGIGLAIARQLGALGHTVLVGARDPSRGEAAAASLRAQGADARFLRIDLTDAPGIAGAAAAIDAQFARLDVLVNNAAIKLERHPAPPSACPLERVRETYETNVFGTMAVILAMLPLLRKSPAARIVNLSSVLGSLSLAADPRSQVQRRPMLGYNTSKAAINALTLQFANELRASGIKVNAADPGYTATDMTGNDGKRTAEQAATVAVRLATLPDDGPTGGFFSEAGAVPW
ncbi:MAG: SDR family NAD(P)-dependent oxidoreductase [Gammaproteobacteria bacterium]